MAKNFRLGAWLVEPRLNAISRNGVSIHLTPKVMGVLLCLGERAGDVVTKEVLLETVWPGIFVGDDVLKGYISDLRRVLEDDAREPKIIQTIPKTGYRLIAPVEWADSIESIAQQRSETARAAIGSNSKLRIGALAALIAALLLVFLGAFNFGRVRTWLSGSRPHQIRSIAVLPLRNLSSDPNQEYFSDGLTDALITDLAQVGSLKVISHTSTMQYKDAKKTLPEIARELNVDGIIEGTVQRSGECVRITAQLLYGPSDKHLWANSYEGDFSNILAMERDVSEDIARQVEARLNAPIEHSANQLRPVDPKVLESYLQGNYHLSRYGKGAGQEEQKKADEYFQEAIGADPNFAPAYVGLASAHKELLVGSSEDVAIRKKSLEKALELDSNDSDARAWLGWLKWQPLLDWQGAESEFRRAITLNPNSAKAHAMLSLLLITLRRKDEGLRECRIAQQLDPNRDHMSLALYLAREYDASIQTLQTSLQRDPNNGELRCFLYGNYRMKGMQHEAIEELVHCYSLFGETRAAGHIREAYAVAGYLGATRQWVKELENLQAMKHVFLPGNLATAYTILGDKDHAFYWLEQAYEHREMVSIDGGVYFLSADPPYDPLRSDPRFKDLLRRIGLT